MRKSIALFITLSLVGCGKKEEATPPPKDKEAPPTKVEQPPTKVETPPEPKDSKIHVDGFSTPESVLFDDQTDLYLVSNIKDTPFAKDDNGFISQVAPDGVVRALQWIDGAKPDVTLNAPKGLAFLGDTLYVADIDTVRMFDRKSGAPKGEVVIKGATFLNDVAAGDGVVYVSDSGLGEGFKPTGTDAIWEIKDGKATAIAKQGKDLDLGRPNGLAVVDGKIWVVTFGTGELYRLDGGKKVDAVKLPKGSLDGIVVGKDGKLLISSWEGQAVFEGPAAGPFTEKVTGVESPADIGLDLKRNRLLIPLFQKNAIEIHPLGQ
jgi:sugar lactone lactonase YvrE